MLSIFSRKKKPVESKQDLPKGNTESKTVDTTPDTFQTMLTDSKLCGGSKIKEKELNTLLKYREGIDAASQQIALIRKNLISDKQKLNDTLEAFRKVLEDPKQELKDLGKAVPPLQNEAAEKLGKLETLQNLCEEIIKNNNEFMTNLDKFIKTFPNQIQKLWDKPRKDITNLISAENAVFEKIKSEEVEYIEMSTQMFGMLLEEYISKFPQNIKSPQ